MRILIGDRAYDYIVYDKGRTAKGERVLRYTYINPARQAKKATGLAGRQWVRFRKERQRALRAPQVKAAA